MSVNYQRTVNKKNCTSQKNKNRHLQKAVFSL